MITTMKHLLTASIVLLLLQGGATQQVAARKAPKVFICTGGHAYAYHNNRRCKGLNRCKAEIRYVSLAKAKATGRKKRCGYCYR